jgi:hypothetical protein
MQQIKGGKASTLNKGLPMRLNASFRSSFSSIHPLLDFQQRMKRKCKRNNPETVMRVKQMPGNVQTTGLLDGISPDSASGTFNENLHEPDKWEGLKGFRCLKGGVLLAPDGLWNRYSGASPSQNNERWSNGILP